MDRFDGDVQASWLVGAARRSGPRSVLVAGLATAIVLGALAAAPAALATGTNYQWTGSDTALPSWSQTDNWLSGTSPTGAIGTLSFPDLGAACDNGTSSDACYSSDDELGPLTAANLVIDDDQAYSISTTGSSALTLTGGLTAAPTETGPDSATGYPLIDVPITLGSDQTWSIDGGTAGNDYGIEVPQISGGTRALNLNFANGGTLATTALGANTVVANGAGTLVLAQMPGLAFSQLPSGGITLQNGASFYATEPGASGPLDVSGSVSAQPTVAIGDQAAPDPSLTVAGAATFDQWTNLFLDLDNNDTTPGDGGFSALLTAGGNINLGDATVYLEQGWADQSGDCTTLNPGDSFPVISAGGVLNGDLTYFDTSGNFDTLSAGETSQPVSVTLPSGCVTGTAPAASATAVLTYLPQAIRATIVAAPVQSSAPAISGTAQVGQTLSKTSDGNWSASAPAVTGYSYQWLACSTSTSCSPIEGASAPTFTLTSAQDGDQIELQVTATNSLGSSSADSNSLGPVIAPPGSTPTTPTSSGPTATQVKAALGTIGHPAGAQAIKALTKSGAFKARFVAPRAGTLSITWTTTVTTGHGKHRKHRNVTIATGTGHARGKGTLSVTVHLTAAGRSRLKLKPHGLAIIATDKFRPTGQSATTVTRHFSL